MQLQGTRVLITGAAGGIGSAVAEVLAQRGAALALVGRSRTTALASLQQHLSDGGAEAHAIPADLLDAESRARAVDRSRAQLGGIDMLVNCAGMTSFRPFAEEDPALLQQIVQLNLVAPMLMARAVLPEMLVRGAGRVVNVGSTFGSIGFAWFSAYSASKFGLRGLSEALRRELDGSGVGVTYVAPRAVRTSLNTDAVYRMAQVTGMHMDSPSWVADRVVAAIESDAKDVYLGFPEKLFARLNGFLPRLVDGGLRKQNRAMETFARAP